ncbi:unnamed protein product [Discosporangium mesarthrocarpum]
MGREYSQMGRVFKIMVKMLVQKYGHMFTNGIGVWTTHTERAASVIRPKTGMQAHQDKGRIRYFVDGAFKPNGRPLDDVAQAATYSGHKRKHGIKFQGVLTAQWHHRRFLGYRVRAS